MPATYAPKPTFSLPRLLFAAITALIAMLGVAALTHAETARANVIVNPGPASKNASIYSELSFRGIKPARAGRITIQGGRSGKHGFAKKWHSDKRGFSLIPKRAFAVSEWVKVTTGFKVYGAGKKRSWRFRTENLRLPRGKKMKQVARPKTGQPGYQTRPGLTAPRLDIKEHQPETTAKPLFIASKQGGNMIYSADGDLRWFRPGITMDLRRQMWNGQPVLTWIESPTKGSGLNRNTYMIANRKYKIIRKLTPGNGYSADTHEFRLTGRGTAYITAYRTRIRDLRKVGQAKNGRVLDSIAQEIDLKTGRVVWEWHSLDQVPVGETYAERPRRPGNPFDYFHINTVADTPDGNVIVSGRSTNAAYKINRRTGRVMWRLGGKRSTFRMGAGTAFSWQHDTRLLKGNRLTIYDNSDSPVTSKPWAEESSGLVLKLNYKNKTANLVSRIHNPDRPLASTQGNMQSLANGNWLIGWGGVPVVSEHTADGSVLFNARVNGVSSFYRAYRSGWHGRPNGRPTVVAKRTANEGQIRFWVSHNGDTDTVRWQVLAGPAKNQLSEVVNRVRDGFETVAAAPTEGPFVQVRGFDRKDRPTGVSKVIRVGG